MDTTKKIIGPLTLRCLFSLAAGLFVVALFAALLSLYGQDQERLSTVTAQQSLMFPENEKMLDAVASQLARDGAALANIAPAAGDASPQKN